MSSALQSPPSVSRKAEPPSASAATLSPVGEACPKQRLLDAAERLFAERGFDGASMRAITAAAGMSVSSANYHFGSKEALLAATLRRHVEPLNRRRLERLDLLEASGTAPPLEAVLHVFLAPVFEEPDERAGLQTVVLRLYSDPRERVEWLKAELFSELRMRFVAAMRRALPSADEERLSLGFQFCIGIMLHAIAGHVPGASGGASERSALVDAMTGYAASGIRALVGEE